MRTRGDELDKVLAAFFGPLSLDLRSTAERAIAALASPRFADAWADGTGAMLRLAAPLCLARGVVTPRLVDAAVEHLSFAVENHAWRELRCAPISGALVELVAFERIRRRLNVASYDSHPHRAPQLPAPDSAARGPSPDALGVAAFLVARWVAASRYAEPARCAAQIACDGALEDDAVRAIVTAHAVMAVYDDLEGWEAAIESRDPWLPALLELDPSSSPAKLLARISSSAAPGQVFESVGRALERLIERTQRLDAAALTRWGVDCLKRTTELSTSELHRRGSWTRLIRQRRS